MNGMTVSQRMMGGAGIVYLLIGVLGFIPGITIDQGNGQGLLLGIFAVNTLHNVAHLLLGAIMLWGSMAGERAIVVAKAMAVVFAVLFVGTFIAPIVEAVAINLPDSGLHLVSALLTGYVGFMMGRTSAATAGAH